MVIRVLKDLREKMGDLSVNLNEEIVSIKNYTDTIKKNQSKMQNTVKNAEYRIY